MFHFARIAAVAAALTATSAIASAQGLGPFSSPFPVYSATGVQMAPVANRKSAERPRVLQQRHVRLNTEASDVPAISVVGPDNYKYARQACCF